MRDIELLAPARDLTTGLEAIRHGADAVYIGAPKFGARAAAGNSVEDIAELVRFARAYKVKVYVTLNTILFDNELDEAQQLAEQLADIGVDALIVQDMALCAMANGKWQMANDQDGNQDFCLSTLALRQLRLHASTQMDNRTAEKVAWLRDLGFEQVVLARELTLEEIREIHYKVPDVRLEVFVHGAICVSYNGQCYASQHCFGRSANRGECAQFCRMPFDLVDGKGNVLQKQRHLLSLRDMNRSAELEALLDAGASSLKIEGRLKDTAYVKNVVAYYRQRLDEIFRRRPDDFRRSSLGHEVITFTPNPAKSFNRLFTNYFLYGRTPDMANICTPKSMGEPLPVMGEAVKGLLHNGDGLCYIDKNGTLAGFRVNRADKFSLPPQEEMGEGRLYRNCDHDFEQQLSKPSATRKVAVRWLLKEVPEGFLLRLTREDGEQTENIFTYPHELARSPQKEQIMRQLSRLGDTPFEATAVDIEMADNWFIPGSLLAEWRRKILPSPTKSSFRERENASPSKGEVGESLIPSSKERAGSLSFLYNVANHAARQFYLDHGASQVEWAMEVAPPKKATRDGQLIMTCRYCIRYELGLCLKDERRKAGNESSSPLFLRLADGRLFRLHFDCRQCQMRVFALCP